MRYDEIEALRDRHPAWRLLRAQTAALVLGFLGQHFVEANNGATAASLLTAGLDDYLYSINAASGGEPRFPRPPQEYLQGWSEPESGWLRRFYPAGSDEVHYDATSEFEKAYAWVETLKTRPFVGTESRLHTVLDLLRQIAYGTEADPQVRLAVLREQRDEIDRQIHDVQVGNLSVLGDTEIRDRYQQFARLARELLSDFREVEENFRSLDRAARERIASWTGSKGDLLAELVSSRSDISGSDQGSSFQAFYDFLLSESRQDDVAELLLRVQTLAPIEADHRLRTVHHDWAEAAERTQRTVRQISEQLRKFLDDQVWVENRRVLDLVRSIESAALTCRAEPPDTGLVLDLPGVPITLPFERPLYDARPAAKVQSMIDPVAPHDVDVSVLFSQTFVDQGKLAEQIRSILPARSTTLLTDILTFYPISQGAAEIIGYLSLTEGDLEVTLDESEETLVEYVDVEGRSRRARLPKTTVRRQ